MAKKDVVTFGIKEITPVIDAKQYEIEDLGDVKPKLKLGGSDVSKFVPNINASFFNDEFYFNLNRKDKIVTNEIAFLASGKVTQSIDDDTDEYYIDADGNFKWDIVWNAKPKKLKLEWEIEHAEGIDFFYQPELTPEEIADGCIRPDNVIGSYAVYCNKANNKHKTGKLCHIYRPFVIDANNKKEWCPLEIKNKKLTIDLPEAFMQTAVYPVRLDPTFGYSTAGASSGGFNTLTYGTSYQTEASSGAISKYHVAIAAIGVDAGIKLGCYNCNQGNGDPRNQNLVENYVIGDVSVSDDNEFATSEGASLSASTYYHLAFIVENSSTKVKYDSVAGTWGFYRSGQVYADELVDPYDDGTTGNTYKFSIWIDYGSGGSTYNESISESASISDSPSNVAALLAAIAESNAIVDSTSNLAVLLNAISEITTISDTVSNAAILIEAISEATTVTDLFNAILTFNNSISESTAITDQSDAASIISASISESANISDTLSALATFICAITDDTAITDLFTSFLGNILEISESVSVTDSMSSIATLLAQVNESATATDNFSSIATLLASISEATTITDLLSAGNIYLESISESVTISDLISVMTAISKYISATMTIKNKISGTMQIKGIVSGELTATGKIKGVLQ